MSLATDGFSAMMNALPMRFPNTYTLPTLEANSVQSAA